MATFPTIKSGFVTCFGFSRAREFRTGVATFLDKSEQRWLARDQLARATLVFEAINGYDYSKLLAFWRSAKGADDATWTLPPLKAGDPAYINCFFESDEWNFTES